MRTFLRNRDEWCEEADRAAVRRIARRQARKLRKALAGKVGSHPGFPPLPGVWYPCGYRGPLPSRGCEPRMPEANSLDPEIRTRCAEYHQAWRIGYHAGRVMAARLALEAWK